MPTRLIRINEHFIERSFTEVCFGVLRWHLDLYQGPSVWENSLVVKRYKFFFGGSQVEYLCHIITAEGRSRQPLKDRSHLGLTFAEQCETTSWDLGAHQVFFQVHSCLQIHQPPSHWTPKIGFIQINGGRNWNLPQTQRGSLQNLSYPCQTSKRYLRSRQTHQAC